MSTVAIATCEDYDYPRLEKALEAALEPLGTISAFVSPGDRVLVKANVLSRAVPERAVTTHPEFIRAIIRIVRDAGGVPFVGDSPGGPNLAGHVERIWNDTGLGRVCAEEGVELVLFDDAPCRVPTPDGELFATFLLGQRVVDADVVISAPKFKTHGLMMFTGAVKNLFGCVPGLEKAQFHLKVPDRDDFGNMLVDLMLACKPTLALMDAVVGMEGDGPAGGSPRKIGAVLASADCVALDVVASAMAGLDPMEVYTNKAAARRGLGPVSVDDVDVRGADWRALTPDGFELPARDAASKLPVWLARRLRMFTTAKPVLSSPAECTRCNTCVQVCPVEAVVVTSAGPVFDRDACIRCYCCQELCPPQCIGLDRPLVSRIVDRRTRL